jgi:hypothetical protein
LQIFKESRNLIKAGIAVSTIDRILEYMKNLMRIIKFGSAIFIMSSVYSCRVLYYNIPDVNDYKIFPSRTIKHSEANLFIFDKAEDTHQFGNEIFVNNKPVGMKLVDLNTFCGFTKTSAFLIIRNDSVIYEYYGKGNHEPTIYNPFSITKAFVTTLTGIAIKEGKIESVDDPVSKYLVEFKESKVGEIKIRQLLKHTSGIKFNDNNIGNARYYYCKSLRKHVYKTELDNSPGIEFKYSSANTQLLAMLIERVIDTTLSAYLESRLWQILGVQYDATWSMDRKGGNAMEKAFSGLNCTSVDMAKLGRLYLQNGKWDNKTILPEDFVKEATKRDISEGSRWDYQFNLGTGPKKYGSFYAVGVYGQLIYVYPEKNVVMVRLAEVDTHYNPPLIYHTMLQIIDQL